MPVPDTAVCHRTPELLAEYRDHAFTPLDLNADFPFSIFRGSKGDRAVVPESEHPHGTVCEFFDLISATVPFAWDKLRQAPYAVLGLQQDAPLSEAARRGWA